MKTRLTLAIILLCIIVVKCLRVGFWAKNDDYSRVFWSFAFSKLPAHTCSKTSFLSPKSFRVILSSYLFMQATF